MALEDDFKNAVVEVKKTNPNNEEKLKLYGLYKQINDGNCNRSKPWAYQLEESAKWKAWDGNRNKSKEECMGLYINLVNIIKAK